MIFHIKDRAITFENGHMTTDITSDRLLYENDKNFHLEKYGFEMSPRDIQNYSAHICIWEYIFIHNITKPCIVIENDVELIKTYDEIIENVHSLENEWDLIIPYNKLGQGSFTKSEIFPSRLGYYWGSYFYILNAKYIKNILTLKNIKQPIDEELLEASFNNTLKTLVLDTDWFKYDEAKCPVYKDRGLFFLEKIKEINLWEDRHKEQAISILLYLAEKAKELGLNLFAHAGTLLGIIRHDDIMPWDDDVDLCMDENEINILLKAVEQDNTIKYTKRLWHKTGSEYYKFFYQDGEYKEGYDYSFPFVDIWLLFNKPQNSYLTSDGYEAFKDDYLPGKPYNLYNADIFIPNKHEIILNKMYNNWDKYIKIFSWSHRLKENCISSIIAPIKTNNEGKLISH
ncbi:LicD family protein [Chryseobacterium flavum]|uniref:LicD family protein n=1 Tax=Chryseobacterium flavum TaxID=415851 RepID=UPI0028A76AC9|nr:LicD family protein [Chryseobacterium flavum]